MRDIIFRGKSLIDGEWRYGNLIIKTDAYGKAIQAFINNRISGVQYEREYPEANLITCCPVDMKTVGQYTGQQDINNMVGIYEGDILKDEENFIWEVIFNKGKLICENMHIPGRREIQVSDRIVGNIHDGIDLDECSCSEKDCDNCKLYFAENI